MESNSLEIVLFSRGTGEGQVGLSLKKEVVELLARTLLPLIVKGTIDSKKLMLISLNNTPAIYTCE